MLGSRDPAAIKRALVSFFTDADGKLNASLSGLTPRPSRAERRARAAGTSLALQSNSTTLPIHTPRMHEDEPQRSTRVQTRAVQLYEDIEYGAASLGAGCGGGPSMLSEIGVAKSASRETGAMREVECKARMNQKRKPLCSVYCTTKRIAT
eukprot:7167725-Prymnesium_polylepis.1